MDRARAAELLRILSKAIMLNVSVTDAAWPAMEFASRDDYIKALRVAYENLVTAPREYVATDVAVPDEGRDW